jgi:hypothetical protein
LAPLIDNVAAAVAWVTWRQPPPPPELPSHLQEARFRKAFKRNSVRARERQGALVGVRVLDPGRTANAKPSKSPDDVVAGRQSPIPHLRSGHFRRVRIGPRTDFRYEVRWIPPVWVQGDPDRATERLVVRRIPAPASWTQPAPHPQPPLEPSGILQPDGTPAPRLARAVPDEDSLGIDLQ